MASGHLTAAGPTAVGPAWTSESTQIYEGTNQVQRIVMARNLPA